MDPITLIVTALATGAAAGLKPSAEQAIADAYQGLKALILRKYNATAPTVNYLESRPERETARQDMQSDLAKTDAAQDTEVLAQAQTVLKAVAEKAPEVATTIGISLENIRVGASLNIGQIVVHSDGSGPTVGLKGNDIETTGDLTIGPVTVTSGQSGSSAYSAPAPAPAAPPAAPSPTPVRVLFLTANPTDTTRLRLGAEMRAIDDALIRSQYRDRFDLIHHQAVRVADLQQLLQRHKPHIVHFSGHGSDQGEIILEDEAGLMRAVSSRALSTTFSLLRGDIRCVILNACYSQTQAAAIAQSIPCVVGMSTTITDPAATSFAAAFYQALGYGQNLQTAFELGKAEIDLESLGEENTPQLLHPSADPAQIVFVEAAPPKA